MRKLIYLVLDGAAGTLGRETALSKAVKPGLDRLAELGACGLTYTVSRGVAPESDAAVMSILGYDPIRYYTGRGPIEAAGAGILLSEGEVAFRANFATVEPPTLRIVDRRVGRSLRTDEARELASSLDGMGLSLPGSYVKVRATVGHRAVVVMGVEGRELSERVENTDPAYRRAGLMSVAVPSPDMRVRRCEPLDSSPEARLTAELVNEFTRRAIEILDRHPVNEERRRRGLLPANAILLRDAGARLPPVEPISQRYGLSFGAVAEMPVEIGISRLLGMSTVEVPPPSGDLVRDMPTRLDATIRLLRSVDVAYVHLKGPDEPGHDGDMGAKVEAIETIDEMFVRPLIEEHGLGEELHVLVTSDHATPCWARAHTDDPVPTCVAGPDVPPDPVNRFDEESCSRGSLGITERGCELLPKILGMLGLTRRSS